jgi:hypothetical protein
MMMPVAATAAPAVVMAPAPAPAIMMSASASAHMAVTMSMSMAALDLDRIVLNFRSAARRYSQPRGGRHRHRDHRDKHRDSNQQNSSHCCFLQGQRNCSLLPQFPDHDFVPGSSDFSRGLLSLCDAINQRRRSVLPILPEFFSGNERRRNIPDQGMFSRGSQPTEDHP